MFDKDSASIYRKNIGKCIRENRRKINMTIEEMGEILNISPGFIGLIERGERGTSISNLVKISEFFNISLDDMVKSSSDVNDEHNKSNINDKILENYIKTLGQREINFFIELIKMHGKFYN